MCNSCYTSIFVFLKEKCIDYSNFLSLQCQYVRYFVTTSHTLLQEWGTLWTWLKR